MARWRTSYMDALGRLEARRPPRQPPANVDDMLATRDARDAQIESAYRKAVRDARAAGRQPPQRASIARRMKRYATGENRPKPAEITRMRGVHRRQQKKEAGIAEVEANLAFLNRHGGMLAVDDYRLQVSKRDRRGDKHARLRAHIDAQIRPGDLDRAVDALRERDWQTLDDEMTNVVLNARYFQGNLTGTDSQITDAGRTQFFPGL